MLIIVSGPDRVGKSTLIEEMAEQLEGGCFVAHHGPPPEDQDNIFDFYREDLEVWSESGHKHAIFDRAYPCSYILEQHRRRNAGHFEDVIDFEIQLASQVQDVVHLGVFRLWYWSAPLHLEEVRAELPTAALWRVRDEYIARMQEHQLYTEQILNFYENITMFPNVQLHHEFLPASTVITRCQSAIKDGRPGT